MGLFDTIRCEFPLPDSRQQDLEYQTKDLDCLLQNYTITADGRLVRHARAGRGGPERDVEWPIHADVLIYAPDPESERDFIEYVVRFTHGRVEWVRLLDDRPEALPEYPFVKAPTPGPAQALIPGVRGRLLTAEEFMAHAPEKLELVGGEIPEAEALLLLLLTQVGLRRAAMLVGRSGGGWLWGTSLRSRGSNPDAFPRSYVPPRRCTGSASPRLDVPQGRSNNGRATHDGGELDSTERKRRE